MSYINKTNQPHLQSHTKIKWTQATLIRLLHSAQSADDVKETIQSSVTTEERHARLGHRHARCAKTLTEMAVQDRECLGNAWEYIFGTLTQID